SELITNRPKKSCKKILNLIMNLGLLPNNPKKNQPNNLLNQLLIKPNKLRHITPSQSKSFWPYKTKV
ncbi:hypothetical protein S245_044751, partial [Arachis hypogaea]